MSEIVNLPDKVTIKVTCNPQFYIPSIVEYAGNEYIIPDNLNVGDTVVLKPILDLETSNDTNI